jgi:tetratricopeptide (TPR) repeat protein
MKKLDVLFALTALAAGTALPLAHAADPAPAPPSNPVAAPRPTANDVSAEMAAARAAIRASNWQAAIAELNKATAKTTTNADVYNLLGYASRKGGDVPRGMEHYATALRLNPNHRATLEYQGEGFLQMRQLDRAEANLATLQRVCGGTACEEYQDLARAIAAFKAGQALPANKPGTSRY